MLLHSAPPLQAARSRTSPTCSATWFPGSSKSFFSRFQECTYCATAEFLDAAPVSSSTDDADPQTTTSRHIRIPSPSFPLPRLLPAAFRSYRRPDGATSAREGDARDFRGLAHSARLHSPREAEASEDMGRRPHPIVQPSVRDAAAHYTHAIRPNLHFHAPASVRNPRRAPRLYRRLGFVPLCFACWVDHLDHGAEGAEGEQGSALRNPLV